VLPGKIVKESDNKRLPRYMILGNYDRIFEIATTFREAQPAADGTLAGLARPTPFPVSPESGAVINSRLPRIAADLSTLQELDPATLTMRVSGFGQVPATYALPTKQLTCRVTRRLRQRVCKAAVDWLDTAGKKPANPLHWAFQIDRAAAYLPEQAEPPHQDETPADPNNAPGAAAPQTSPPAGPAKAGAP